MKVVLKGRVNGDADASVSLETDAKGHAIFFPVPQGVYDLALEDPQSLMSLRTAHSLFAGIGSARQFLAPDFAAVRTRITSNPPLPFPNDRMVVEVGYSGGLSVGDCRWFTGGRFLTGKAGMYEVAKAGEQYRMNVKQPTPFLLLPPMALEMTASPRFLDPKESLDHMSTVVQSQQFTNNEKQQITLQANQENTATVKLDENHVKAAVQYMMGYTQKKWLPEMDPASPPLNVYVAAAFTIGDAKRVSCKMESDAAATVSLSGVNEGQPQAATAPGNGSDWLMLRIADPANLAKTYHSLVCNTRPDKSVIEYSTLPKF